MVPPSSSLFSLLPMTDSYFLTKVVMSLTFDGGAVLRHDVAGQRRQGDGHKHHEQAGDLVLLLWTDVFCTDQSKASAVKQVASQLGLT